MKLKAPVAQRINLVDMGLPIEMEDESNPSWVEVRQSSMGDEMFLAGLFSETSRVYGEDGKLKEVRQDWNGIKVQAARTYRTLSGSGNIDIEDPFTKDLYKPAFIFAKENGIMKVNMTEEQFNEAFNRLPQPVADAIYNAVITVNQQWANPK